MSKKLLSNAIERHIVVKDKHTKSGYRILSDYPHFWGKHQYIFVPTPDYSFGYILMSFEYGKIKIYHEIVEIFRTTKEASDWVFEHKKGK